jgi:hypothetical protein
MHPFTAHVHSGRIVLDEPTSLPDGDILLLAVGAFMGDTAAIAAPDDADEPPYDADLLAWEDEGGMGVRG